MTFQKMTGDPVRDAERHTNEQERLSDEADDTAEQLQKELWLKLQTKDGAVEVDAEHDLDVMYEIVALIAKWQAKTDVRDKFNQCITADVVLQAAELIDKRIVEISNE